MTADFDCIVVGGGHAGCEAAAALARLGHRTLLVTGNIDRLGHLSCNPAIGGLAKSHMVRELDALGGSMALWADQAGIQMRVLNMSKGPAVRATRGQMDREAYMRAVKKTLSEVLGGGEAEAPLRVDVMSFGFKRGLPACSRGRCGFCR